MIVMPGQFCTLVMFSAWFGQVYNWNVGQHQQLMCYHLHKHFSKSPFSPLFKASLPPPPPSYNPSPVSIFQRCLQRKCKWHLSKVINCCHYPSQVLQIIPHSTN